MMKPEIHLFFQGVTRDVQLTLDRVTGRMLTLTLASCRHLCEDAFTDELCCACLHRLVQCPICEGVQ